LVIEHNLAALVRRFFEWFQVIMGSTRTAVQTEQWQSIWAPLIADYSVPNLEIAKRDMTFTNWDDRRHGIRFSLAVAVHDVEAPPNNDLSTTQTSEAALLKSTEASARLSAGILCALGNVSNSKMPRTHNLLTQIFTGC
jgi:hypothetical protein